MRDDSYLKMLEGGASFEDSLSGIEIVGDFKMPTHKLSEGALRRVFVEIEKLDADVGAVLISKVAYSEMRKFDTSVFVRSTDADMLRQGIVGTVWKALVIPSLKIPPGVVLAVSAKGRGGRRIGCMLTLGSKHSEGAKSLMAIQGKAEEVGHCLGDLKRSLEGLLEREHGVMAEGRDARLRGAVREMDKAVHCLALEVPGSVHDDVRAKWESVKSAMDG